MPRIAESSARRALARLAAALLPAGLAAALLAAVVLAQTAARVESPHGKFKEDCQLCHNATSWKTVRVSPKFDHAKYGFPLEGAHATSDCMACHSSLDFSQSRAACASCHQDPHRGEMGTDCARCHGARSFIDRAPMVRAHMLTRFPLTGTHAAADCEDCHHPAAQGQLQYKGVSTECSDCHMDQYRGARDPDHVAGGFPTTCQSCHSTGVWTTATFNHDLTGFPLTGAHRAAHCQQCHTTGDFKSASPACYSCHAGTYATASPTHTAASFPPSACGSCHTTTSWSTPFDHATTGFPLTGAHASASCASCHGDGVYIGKSTACYSCHATDYANASPTHTTASFPPAACGNCHNTTTFANATFDHNLTTFPLTGAHVNATCADCHGDGVYAGKSTACLSCHTAEWNTPVVNHTAAGFDASQCASCHNTTAWAGAQYLAHDASYFRIYSGRHVGTWTTCSQCHDVSTNFASFTCITCHPHDSKSQTDSNHAGVSGYTYTATSCYSCHRNV